MIYDGSIYSKYCLMHHYETLLKDLSMCVHEHKVVSRCYTPPLLIVQGT